MVKMCPSDIEGCKKATEGEKRVFRFLMEAARPHNDFLCWYEPPIGKEGKLPDFLLFGKKLGLLVLEVKDWNLRQIVEANPATFSILISGKVQERTNPDVQAKGYVDALMDKLKETKTFLADTFPHQGKMKIPIGRMVVFPNINREEYSKDTLQYILPPERVMLEDDLDAAGAMLCDMSGKKFHDRISPAFPFHFEGLTPNEIGKLVSKIWPERKIDLPERKGPGKTRFQTEVQYLDEAQAKLALQLKGGHQIIKGPPGTGKSLILVHRCCHLQNYKPEVKRILFVCYNIALVSYLKRLLQEKGLGVGVNGIHICHFFELCSRILDEKIQFEGKDSEYYETWTQWALEAVQKGEHPVGKFDAILVDEGQDFDNDMLRTLIGLLKPEGDLVIALDAYQDLYRRETSWKSLGIEAKGRTRYLKPVYRNTVELYNFTQQFIGEKPEKNSQLNLFSYEFAFHGDPPEIITFGEYDELEDFVIEDIKTALDSGDYKRSEIAIIYDDKTYDSKSFKYEYKEIPVSILEKLESGGIPAKWVSQDVRAKEMFDITTDRISLISIHSSKGLDFDMVYLLGIDHINPTEDLRDKLQTLIYVATTRAKYRLVIPYVEESEYIRRMKNCLPKK